MINENNFLDAFQLKLADGQEKYVSNPIRSLAQAYVYRKQCQPFGASNRVTLTCNKNNQVALKVYHKAGFVETGEEDDEEIELSQRLYQYITLREMPSVKEKAAEWFHSKWGVSKEAYFTDMASGGTGSGGTIALLGWCAYFIPIGVLA